MKPLAWARRLKHRLRRRADPSALDLTGDRQIVWSFVAGHIPDGGRLALDFGCGNAPLALVAALKGYQVLAIDLQPVQWSTESPLITFVQADINAFDFGGRRFDVILNCSTVEHAGLAGRYGSSNDPDADLKAMVRLRQLLAPAGRMLLTIPVGQDMVCAPLHRIYGSARLPQLLAGYRLEHAEFWMKRAGRNVWVTAPELEAQAVVGSPAFYALGLFVLAAA